MAHFGAKDTTYAMCRGTTDRAQPLAETGTDHLSFLDQLLANVKPPKDDCRYRPLIFIGHSFGGNVIEQVCTYF